MILALFLLLLVAVVAAIAYVGWSLLRIVLQILHDPDTEDLLDGK